MNTNISEIAKKYEDAIRNNMAAIELELNSSVPEDEELVRRAAFLARHNYVKISSYSEVLNILHFVVQDATPATATLYINDDLFTCDCRNKKWCRHKLAAMFVLYQYVDSLSGWLENFRSQKLNQLSLFKDERTPESWLKLVENIYKVNLYNQQSLNPYLIESIFADMQSQIAKHTPLEREWRSLYQLFTHMALLSHTWKHLHPANESARSYMINFIEQESQALKDYIRLTASKSRLFATDPFYDTLQQMTHYFLVKQEGYFEERLYIYTLFWESMFNEKKRRELELDMLRAEKDFSSDVNIESIRAMFFLMLKKYDDLQQSLTQIKVDELLVWLDLAHFADRNEDSEALQMILRSMLPLLDEFINSWLATRYRSNFVNTFNRLCSKIDLTDEEAELLFTASGMYGMQPFSHYLIEKERYLEWAALHHRFPSSLAYLELCGVKDVLEYKPEVLLPLYHALALEEVSQKSRQHYKQAVRVWKKMKAAAKKSAKNEYWNQYVETLRQQYKRLRALQEEIEKGNLKL
ncbi:hypothetical protein MKZ08_19275 [Viridibacillus sp. FSL R5-0477]|uniref:SWIM-type domain-containing protein n=1 Tax=Viridibacillus arenosi FSL R5-213 TaxID=1227360 RepID=W4F4C6_9BACL|nr:MULTISPECIES: hypothetical protein [Viridibacillus]ETT87177.1 hypothetical protein C176_03473 [Viridibacillus arenosi FSL R5-213]OMC80219.1 hypothetical protein BK130_17840 [Viridibacillus sp. FSL H8-0123]OMC87989.1 hypothetical protein BK128_06635 [Viridibacillus sp. FSL H7-0596]OMC91540.1 hypothetical protein BK137_10760 [Viridibacillus arenosi]